MPFVYLDAQCNFSIGPQDFLVMVICKLNVLLGKVFPKMTVHLEVFKLGMFSSEKCRNPHTG